MRSDIFDEYAKIAIAKGLVSSAEDEDASQPDKPKESAKLRKYKKSPHPRMGSDDITTIEALYGVRDKDDPIKYEHCIMEAAHPKPVVIGPAYDRINALVENNIERQNIIINQVLKPNDGISNQTKLAKKELLLELVRLATDLDNSNHNDLCTIADTCIETLSIEKKKSSQRVKVAIAPLLFIGIGAAILAGIWFWSHANDPDKGLSGNMNNAISQLNDLKTNSWYESDIDDTVQHDVDALISDIQNLQKYVQDFDSAIGSTYKPKSLDNKSEMSKFKTSIETNGDDVKMRIERFVSAIDNAVPNIIRGINNFSSTFYQKEHTKSSMIGDATGWLGEALHGRWGLIANDFTSAVNALNPLKDSLQEARRIATNFDGIKQQEAEKLQSQITSFKQNGNKSDEDVSAEPKTEPPSDDGDEGSEYEALNGKQESADSNPYEQITSFLGHKPSDREVEFFRSLK